MVESQVYLYCRHLELLDMNEVRAEGYRFHLPLYVWVGVWDLDIFEHFFAAIGGAEYEVYGFEVLACVLDVLGVFLAVEFAVREKKHLG